MPVEYEGNLIFEELYEWLKEQKDKRDSDKKNKSKNKMVGGSGGASPTLCRPCMLCEKY